MSCTCSPGFLSVSPPPPASPSLLQCQNIDDCSPINPCQNEAVCVDLIQDYRCMCTLRFNKGKTIINMCVCLVFCLLAGLWHPTPPLYSVFFVLSSPVRVHCS